MNELIIRFLQGQATPEERSQLLEWRKMDAANERQFEAMRELWSLTASSTWNAPIWDLEHQDLEWESADTVIARAEAPVTDLSAGRPGTGSAGPGRGASGSLARDRSQSTFWLKVGGIAAAFGALGFALGALMDGTTERPSALADSEIVTGSGEMTTVTLGDGTSIRVGPRTRLRMGPDGKDRIVWLDGRAFFGVQADSSRDFTVRTQQGEAVVHGTRFEVRSEEEEFRVLVVDGSVEVSAGGAATELTDGEMSRSVEGRPPRKSMVQDIYAHLDWMGNALVFQATPLSKALREVERRYGVETILEDDALSRFTLTVTFTDQALEEVVVVLCEAIGAQCVIDGDRIYVSSGPLSPNTRIR